MNAPVVARRRMGLHEGQQAYIVERVVQATDKLGELIARLHEDKEESYPGTPLGMALDALLLLWHTRWEANVSGGGISIGKSEAPEVDRG